MIKAVEMSAVNSPNHWKIKLVLTGPTRSRLELDWVIDEDTKARVLRALDIGCDDPVESEAQDSSGSHELLKLAES